MGGGESSDIKLSVRVYACLREADDPFRRPPHTLKPGSIIPMLLSGVKPALWRDLEEPVPVLIRGGSEAPSLPPRARTATRYLLGIVALFSLPRWLLTALLGTGSRKFMFLLPRFVQNVPGPLWNIRSTILSFSFSAIA